MIMSVFDRWVSIGKVLPFFLYHYAMFYILKVWYSVFSDENKEYVEDYPSLMKHHHRLKEISIELLLIR